MCSHDVTRVTIRSACDMCDTYRPFELERPRQDILAAGLALLLLFFPLTDKARLSPFSANRKHCVFAGSAFIFSCFLAKSVVKW